MPTPDPTLVRAVQTLAGVCDGAATQDGVGFNGPDSKFGKSLGEAPVEVWTDALARDAWELIAKYRGQLKRVGIDYDSIPEPPKAHGVKGVRAVDVRSGKVLVFLPYGDSAYPKQALSATWNRDLRGWQVAVSKYGSVLSWAERNDIPVTDRAKAILSSAPQPDKPDYGGTALLEFGEIVLKFDYNPKLVDAVRAIPGRHWNGHEKVWIIPAKCVSLVRQLAEDYHLFLTEDVKRLPDHEVTTAPTVSVKGKSFAISFTYDADLLSSVRQMPGSTWSPKDRVWLVPIESVEEVQKFIAQSKAKTSPEVAKLVAEASVVQAVIDASAAHDAEIQIKGFGSEKFQLFPFQRAGVAYAMRQMGFTCDDDGVWIQTEINSGGVLIGDEMGLGKTSQGLGVLKATNSFPAVIVCPASLKLNWKREAEQWIPGVQVKVLSGTKGNLPDADIYIINYDILTHWTDKFVSIKGLVLDESHYIKNGSAQRSKACIRMADKVSEGGVRVCLSGTPIVNQPLEIMTQLRVINRLDEFGGATSFRGNYGRASAKSLAALNRKLRSTCYVRRRKADVLTELPPKRWAHLVVEGDPVVMKEYKKAEADIVKYLSQLAMQLALEAGADNEEARREAWQKALRARAAENLVAITTLKQLAAKAKMKVAKSWIDDFLANDKKLVVFGWHRDIVDMVAENFSNGVKIQGGLTAEKRQEAVDLFQNSDEQKVIACNIKAAGVGLTLTAASDVLFVEQGWTPSDMEQGADRCHRIGQTDSVTAWLMLTAETIDEDIATLIDHKRSIVDRAIDGSDDDDDEETSIIGDLLVGLAERGMQEAS